MHDYRRWRPSALAVLALAVLLPVSPGAAQERTLNAALSEQKAAVQDSARSQARIAQLADETSELLGEYRVTTQRLDRTRIYNENLESVVADQETQKQDIQRQLESFGEVQRDIVPLMLEMIDDLAEFVELDIPFQLDERRGRVDRLRDLMTDSEVTVSERYRQIMNAYQVEADYGRTTEAYSGLLGERKVDFLRVGRILLAYQTPDRAETGYWNKNNKEWEVANDIRNDVTEGLRIARKQAPPSLLRLPVPAPESEQTQ